MYEFTVNAIHDGTIGDFKGGLGAQAPLLKNELRKILRNIEVYIGIGIAIEC